MLTGGECVWRSTVANGDPYGHFNITWKVMLCKCLVFVPWNAEDFSKSLGTD